MKVKVNSDFWNFNHEKVLKQFNGTKFIGEFSVLDSFFPVAVYYSAAPDREKKHKDYFFLFRRNNNLMIGGLDSYDMEEWRYQAGIHCLNCDEVIYSSYRHDFRYCSCKKNAVDGGRDYLKISGNEKDFEMVTIDLLEMKEKTEIQVDITNLRYRMIFKKK